MLNGRLWRESVGRKGLSMEERRLRWGWGGGLMRKRKQELNAVGYITYTYIQIRGEQKQPLPKESE